MGAVVIKLRGGDSGDWSVANPTLAQNEPGYETDTGLIKIGDGATPWNSLGYYYSEIAPGSVTSDSLAESAVTESKIADGAVTANKIEQSDIFEWMGRHTFRGELRLESRLYLNSSSVKLGTNVTVTTDNSSAVWFDLKSGTKTAGILLYPLNPSLTFTANDGAGNFSILGFGSTGFNFQLAGTADIKLNGTSLGNNEVIVGRGAGQTPVRQHLCPPIRYEYTDFHSPNATSVQDPYFGTAIVSGTQSATPPAAFRIDGTMGMCLLRSSTSANSGFRWVTQNNDRIKGQADLYFRAILGIADDMNLKTIHFGFMDATTQTESVDGAYFWLAPGSMVCTPKTANNSTRSSGSTFTLVAGTYYVFEIYWTSAASVNFKILSLDEATTHLDTNITTNIPTSDVRLFGAGIVATSSGTAVDDLCVIDYMGHGFKNRR